FVVRSHCVNDVHAIKPIASDAGYEQSRVVGCRLYAYDTTAQGSGCERKRANVSAHVEDDVTRFHKIEQQVEVVEKPEILLDDATANWVDQARVDSYFEAGPILEYHWSIQHVRSRPRLVRRAWVAGSGSQVVHPLGRVLDDPLNSSHALLQALLVQEQLAV